MWVGTTDSALEEGPLGSRPILCSLPGGGWRKVTSPWCLELQGPRPLPCSSGSDSKVPGGRRRHQNPQGGD